MSAAVLIGQISFRLCRWLITASDIATYSAVHPTTLYNGYELRMVATNAI
jgi:hypothetical protein